VSERLLQLFPEFAPDRPVSGLYLAHCLHELGRPGRPFVYGNFVSSLDGRIALRAPSGGASYLPQALVSTSDFRLLLELHAQAECLITNGAYLRAVSEGRLDDILQVGTIAGHEDLAAWRVAQGLAPQPAICVASASLDFPFPESIGRHGQQVFVATGTAADPARVRQLEGQGLEVIVAGAGRNVEGRPLAQALARKGLRSSFLLAGPLMLETMLRDRALSRLYVTITHQLLGGEAFHSLIDGPEMGATGRLKLMSLYLDPTAPEGTGQFFAQFRPL
jgi:riboflavin biosynthesis pyrimidine reductase